MDQSDCIRTPASQFAALLEIIQSQPVLLSGLRSLEKQMFSPSTPVTGAAQSGFTAPTYNLAVDRPPADQPNAVQWAVTGLGGTQAGVLTNSVAAPFTITGMKPKQLKALGVPNPVTGIVKAVPRNVYTVLTRKGVLPLAGQPYATMIVRTTIEVPAGADLADQANVKAALSLHIGAIWAQSSGIGDTGLTGVL